jgi:selenocysteine lyase/cysteine desulfurase
MEADKVRGKAASLLGCDADEILLTSSTTDAMTTLSNSIQLREGDRVLLTDKEHEGGEVGWLYRERRDGIHVDRVRLRLEDHDPEDVVRRFRAAITRRTKVISVSHVLASTGLRMPIAEIASLARSRGLMCVVDGAQAVGEIDVDVKALGCHAYATSGHKWLMGPKGTGILYVSRDAAPIIEPVRWDLGKHFGSDSAGLGPITLAVGLGAAIDAFLRVGMSRVEERVLRLRNRFYAALQDIPQVKLLSPPPGPLATALIAFELPPAVSAERLQQRLEQRHKIVIKLSDQRFSNGNRFSPHVFNTEADVDRALAALRGELPPLMS